MIFYDSESDEKNAHAVVAYTWFADRLDKS